MTNLIGHRANFGVSDNGRQSVFSALFRASLMYEVVPMQHYVYKVPWGAKRSWELQTLCQEATRQTF